MQENINRAIVLMNLGSPDSTKVGDVRKYLNQFLMDERVIDMPWLKRFILVRGIIVPFRAPKSAEAYNTIWTKEGSPLINITKQLGKDLEDHLNIPVEISMRYGNPSMKFAFDNMAKKFPSLKEVIAVPLYPHYAMSSYETAVEHAREVYNKGDYSFKLKFIEPYYNDSAYIEALADRILPYLAKKHDHILFSYHGIPERHLIKADRTGSHCLQNADCCKTSSIAHKTCYRFQCYETTRLVTERLGLDKAKYSVSFQSRLGRDPWIKPYTDIRLEEMPGQGIKNLLILCPAFVSDCLETLEEIEIRGKESFLEAGGETYEMIPCLNTSPAWIKALGGLVNKEVAVETA